MLNQFNVSIWGDEAFSAILSQKSIPNIISTIIKDTSPPLYNITEHILFSLFGHSEVAIRSLSFLYFLIAIFFTYKIASHFWNKNTAILATILTFLNPFFFSYAFEGRMYSLLGATVTASFYFLITKKWKAYVLATVLALYTHHFAIFAIFIQGLWFIKELTSSFINKNRKRRKDLKAQFLSFLVIGIAYLPWIIPLYNQTKMVGSGFWLGIPTLSDLGGLTGRYLAAGINSPLAKPALVIVLITLVFRKWGSSISKTSFLLLWFLGPILLTWIVSQKFQPIFFDRYLLYTIPSGMLILSSEKRNISNIFLGITIALFILIDFSYFTHPTKPPFKNLANYVLEKKRGDDYIVNWNGASHHLWESKYYGINAPIYLTNKGALPFFVGTALMTPKDIVYDIPKNTFRLGVITSSPVDEVKIANYTEKEVHTFGNLKFIWLTR